MPVYVLPDAVIKRIIELLDESHRRLTAARERRKREMDSVVKEHSVTSESNIKTRVTNG